MKKLNKAELNKITKALVSGLNKAAALSEKAKEAAFETKKNTAATINAKCAFDWFDVVLNAKNEENEVVQGLKDAVLAALPDAKDGTKLWFDIRQLGRFAKYPEIEKEVKAAEKVKAKAREAKRAEKAEAGKLADKTPEQRLAAFLVKGIKSATSGDAKLPSDTKLLVDRAIALYVDLGGKKDDI